MNKDKIIESLVALGGKKDKDGIKYIADQLLIRHKNSGVEYTVQKVSLEKNDNFVLCYRYYSPAEGGKRVFIKIHPKEYNEYEPV